MPSNDEKTYGTDYEHTKIASSFSGLNLKGASPYVPQHASLKDLAGSEDFHKEYLFQGKEPKKRSWMTRISYDVGLCWGIASFAGGFWGAREGLRQAPADASPAIRRNALINGIGKRATFLGNPAAIAALMFNSIEYFAHEKGPLANESANTLISGGLAGLLFKSTAGVRPMAIAGAIGTCAGAMVCVYRNIISGKKDIFDF